MTDWQRPHPNCYWVEPGRFLAGEYPGSPDPFAARQRILAFLDCDIDLLVDLTESWDAVPYAPILAAEAAARGVTVAHHRFPIRDVSVPASPELMVAILDTIDGALDAGHRVYVHCIGGIGRTGTVIGCYLVRHGLSGRQALRELARLWQQTEKSEWCLQTPETEQQRQWVLDWQERQRGPLAGISDMAENAAEERALGCLLGLAVGDALGTAVEFRAPGTFPTVRDLTGGGPFRLLPGQWTDDTAMALCLGTSLLACAGFDAVDQVQRYLRWRDQGELSSTGHCFDIGGTVARALRRYEASGDPFSGPTDPDTAGNGSLMRLAPIPLFYHQTPDAVSEQAAASSRTTHGATVAVDACRFFAVLTAAALEGVPKAELLDRVGPAAAAELALCREVAAVAAGSYRVKEPPAIKGTGYVVECLEAALWGLHRSGSFREGALLAVNLGADADTTAAVYGQLAGAVYGVAGIPEQWLARLTRGEMLADIALQLWRHGTD